MLAIGRDSCEWYAIAYGRGEHEYIVVSDEQGLRPPSMETSIASRSGAGARGWQ